MKGIKKDNLIIVGCALVAVIGFFVGFSLYEQQQHNTYQADEAQNKQLITTSTTTIYGGVRSNISHPSASAQSDLVLTTYLNKDYRYQVTYPAEMKAGYSHEENLKNEDAYWIYFTSESDLPEFRIEASKKDSQLTLEQKMEKDIRSYDQVNTRVTIDETRYVNVNDFYGIQRYEIFNESLTELVTYIKFNGIFYRVSLNAQGEITPESKRKYDTILSTFKVLP